MDQEKTSHSLTLKGKATVEFILQAFYVLAKELHDRHQYKEGNRTFIGEARFNDFMATKSQKDVERLFSSEVHLEKLKHYLEENKVGFTYHTKGEETLLFFETKNRLLAEKAINQMLQDITQKPEKLETFTKRVLKKPHEMTPQEKIAYYQTHHVYQNLKPVATKEIGKEKTR